VRVLADHGDYRGGRLGSVPKIFMLAQAQELHIGPFYGRGPVGPMIRVVNAPITLGIGICGSNEFLIVF
jgi:hypothetical protein